MAKSDLKLLKDRNPEKRKLGIKRVAKALDRDALKQLAIMSEKDREPEIRKLAKKAGIYMRQQLGEIPGGKPAAEKKPAKNGKPEKIEVSPADATKAQNMLSQAMSAQMADDRGKVIKSLEKALALDPNLIEESYFVSLAESATGETGKDAIALLSDESAYGRIVQQQENTLYNKEVEEHMESISKATWADVGFDTALLFVILTVGALVGYFLLLQGADNYQQSIDDNRVAVQEAIDGGRVLTDDEGNEFYYTADVLMTGGRPQKTFTLMDPDPSFMEVVDRLREEVSATDVLLWGIVTGIGSVLLFAVGSALVHVLAGFILRGQGRMPHTLHSTLSFVTGRVVILLVILFAGTFIIFSMGGGVAITGLMGVVGLFLLINVLKLVTMTGQSYNFSPAQGLIAALPVVFAIGVIGYGVLAVPLAVV